LATDFFAVKGLIGEGIDDATPMNRVHIATQHCPMFEGKGLLLLASPIAFCDAIFKGSTNTGASLTMTLARRGPCGRIGDA
jgi:hypothetical protein